jgi:hypothetical protein
VNGSKYINALCGKVQILLWVLLKYCKKVTVGFVEQMIAKLCAAGYVITKMVQAHVSNTLKSIYYA